MEAFGEDLDDLPSEAGLELRLCELGLESKERVAAAAQLAQVVSGGEAEEASRSEHGPQVSRSVGLSALLRNGQRHGGLSRS